ncbi:tryptophan 2,3-dioxygenase family protein [Lentzea sp. DG1S-22]|uniref:tryptophan 2,3-dioxygenase family protein n=1 Tax=Lentzea sp. DG1S-22 TaxID=3108822 RepID=UPI002E75DC1F|nr:tryptophan 2,3-dioxygenase family protein [Lentzea sp. DG1S-22]WVH82769.1 tryptophan 2,3-dioxygenase family protein [Lentzea sp. DG1S-22]
MTTLTYSDYLQVETLLSLQETRSPDTASQAVVLAEHFFIVTHQSCELWLKQITIDLDAAAKAMMPPHGPDDDELALEFLQRSAELLRVLHDQLIALEKLPLRHFAEFRPFLDGASGAQSAQFRLLARLLGGDRQEGRLYQAFEMLAMHREITVSDICALGPAAGVLNRIADALMDVANGYWRWKMTHLALVSKMVGNRGGTGGSSGVEYLARRVTLPFPRLRLLRAQVHDTLLSESPSAGSE